MTEEYQLTVTEFAEIFNEEPDCPIIEALFTQADKKNTGTVSFIEFFELYIVSQQVRSAVFIILPSFSFNLVNHKRCTTVSDKFLANGEGFT